MNDIGMSFAALVEAVHDRREDVAVVANEVGASAAHWGIPLHEVLDHVERAYAGDPPGFEAVRAAVLAWAATEDRHREKMACDDPVTGLSTPGYLRSRLAEVYAGARRDGLKAADMHVLLVVDVGGMSRSPIESTMAGLDVAEVLRSVFPGDESIARITSSRFLVLAHRKHVHLTTARLVRLLLDGVLPEAEHDVRVASLPEDESLVEALLAPPAG